MSKPLNRCTGGLVLAGSFALVGCATPQKPPKARGSVARRTARAWPDAPQCQGVGDRSQAHWHPWILRRRRSFIGSPAKAEPFFLRFPDIYEKRLGPNHPALARPLKNLAHLYGKLGKKKGGRF